jgi:hypothetical protein
MGMSLASCEGPDLYKATYNLNIDIKAFPQKGVIRMWDYKIKREKS